jgi:hypothetical protein
MVGQQITLRASDLAAPPLLVSMLSVAARGGCDVAARQGTTGYLMTRAQAVRPASSELIDRFGRPRRLGESWTAVEPITLTCYPPQAGHAEARRAAFSR